MQVKLIWTNNDYSEIWTISRAGQENNGPTSAHRQPRPGQGYEDQIRTFLAHIVPGSSRLKMVPGEAPCQLANNASRLPHRGDCMLSIGWPQYICVTRGAKISLCVCAAFVLPHVPTHSPVLTERKCLQRISCREQENYELQGHGDHCCPFSPE